MKEWEAKVELVVYEMGISNIITKDIQDCPGDKNALSQHKDPWTQV